VGSGLDPHVPRAWADGSRQHCRRDKIAVWKMLNGQGHAVRPHIRYGTLWFEIDGDMVATRQQLLELADGVYSVEELRGLFVRRHAEEQSRP